MARFDALGVVASDLEAAVAFYSLLGFVFGEPFGDGGHIEAELGHGLRLMIDSESMVQSFSEWTAPSGDGRIAMGLLCDSPAEVDSLYATVCAAGDFAKTEPFDAPWGQRYATVVDPDGNAVDLFAAL